MRRKNKSLDKILSLSWSLGYSKSGPTVYETVALTNCAKGPFLNIYKDFEGFKFPYFSKIAKTHLTNFNSLKKRKTH